MYSRASLVTLAFASLAQAALEVIPPTGQCTDHTEIGQFWTCDYGVFGCAWNGQSYPCNKPTFNVDIGHEVCNHAGGETIVIHQGQGSKAITNYQQCSGVKDPRDNMPYQWVMSQYTWSCCQCPAGYQPAGAYVSSQDGYGVPPYDQHQTGGAVEKTCMRCTDAGEVLTWDYTFHTWSCKGPASTTSKPATIIGLPNSTSTTMKPTTTSTVKTSTSTHTSSTKTKTKTSKTKSSKTTTSSSTHTTMVTSVKKSSSTVPPPKSTTPTTTKK